METIFYVKRDLINRISDIQWYDSIYFQVACLSDDQESGVYMLNHYIYIENFMPATLNDAAIEWDIRRELAHDPQATVVFIEEGGSYPWE